MPKKKRRGDASALAASRKKGDGASRPAAAKKKRGKTTVPGASWPGRGSAPVPGKDREHGLAPAPSEAHAIRGPVGDLLRVPAGPVNLAGHDARATPGPDGGKRESAAALERLQVELSQLQERLFASSRSGSNRRLLLLLQGMDTSGKGGTVRHVVGLVNPQGVRIKAFKAPTAEEKRRGFLWRIREALPRAGEIGAFDRSHYEDVIIARVRRLAPMGVIERRYDAINRFERELVESGCEIIKVMLHISFDEQRERLLARLDDPSKHWKYNPRDVDERLLWTDYQRAYEIALERCNTEWAPWHVVPADRKWYRNWAVTHLLTERLVGMGLEWPRAEFDVAAEIARVQAS